MSNSEQALRSRPGRWVRLPMLSGSGTAAKAIEKPGLWLFCLAPHLQRARPSAEYDSISTPPNRSALPPTSGSEDAPFPSPQNGGAGGAADRTRSAVGWRLWRCGPYGRRETDREDGDECGGGTGIGSAANGGRCVARMGFVG